MKKSLAIILLSTLLISSAFAGCNSKAPDAIEGSSIAANATTDEAMAEGSDTQVNANTDSSAATLPSTVQASTETVPVATDEHKNTAPTVSKADTSDMDLDFKPADTAVPKETEVVETTSVDVQTKPAVHTNVTEITKGGNYVLKGDIVDKTVTVDAGDDEVTIVLSGVNINNSKGPAVFVRSADKVYINLDDGTSNVISDGSSYSVYDSSTAVDGAVFSKSDLTINGNGSVTINGNYKHGIVSKDDLVISSGVVTVNAKNTGVTGKDCVKINSGVININAGKDGVKANNSTDTSKGFVYFYGGTINITCNNDGVQAETVVKIEDVSLSVTTADGGYTKKPSDSTESYKAIKAGSDIYITGGYFNLSSMDDCIHSNGTITIGGGNYTLVSGDDGIHADTDMQIFGGSLKLSTLSKGIDVNGNLSITGGDIQISTNDKAIFDYQLSASVSEGTFIGMGNGNKSKEFSHTAQEVLYVNTDAQSAGSSVKLTDSSGNVLISATADKGYSAVIISLSSLKSGDTYTLTAGSFTKAITA